MTHTRVAHTEDQDTHLGRYIATVRRVTLEQDSNHRDFIDAWCQWWEGAEVSYPDPADYGIGPAQHQAISNALALNTRADYQEGW